MVARRITERMARAVTGRVVSRKVPRLIKMLIMMRVTSDKESGRTISDGAAAAAKGAGTPRARGHSARNACTADGGCMQPHRPTSVIARDDGYQELRLQERWRARVRPSGTAVGHGRRARPSGTMSAVGRSKLQHWRCCSRHGRPPSSRERKGVGLGGCKNWQAVGKGRREGRAAATASLRRRRAVPCMQLGLLRDALHLQDALDLLHGAVDPHHRVAVVPVVVDRPPALLLRAVPLPLQRYDQRLRESVGPFLGRV